MDQLVCKLFFLIQSWQCRLSKNRENMIECAFSRKNKRLAYVILPTNEEIATHFNSYFVNYYTVKHFKSKMRLSWYNYEISKHTMLLYILLMYYYYSF